MKFLYIGFRLPRFEDGQVPPFIGCGCFSPDSDPIPRRSFNSRAKGHPELGKKKERSHDDMWMPLWICSQEKAHVSGEIYQRRELSARAALFCGWWEYKLD